ncbi:MAG TPA: IS110 family transposase [Ilumatobacteraceae bacterium]|nr:IS110 family transposase [Ilumatobacteraceae bacterium]
MSIVAERVDVVIGVDTHKHTHTAALVLANGGIHQTLTVPTNPDGYTTLFNTVVEVGERRVWSIEGCGSWGRGLTRWLVERGEQVNEIERPKRPKRRMGAKNDTIDAVRAAREALILERINSPRATGRRDAIAAALLARQSAIQAGTDSERQLCALANTAPEVLAHKLRGHTTRSIVTTCARWRIDHHHDPDIASIAATMRILARRVLVLRAEAAELERTITAHIKTWRPDLLDVFGVGPIVAAMLLIVWSHPGRIHSPAAFAKLAGSAPIEASTGLSDRHRLSRYGDRQLNRAITTVTLTRIQHDTRTKTYIERRRQQGKHYRDIRRCLKNYIARELFNILETGLDAT